MAVNRLWYPDSMLSRSRVSPPGCSFRRIPSSVESCLQWSDTAAAASVEQWGENRQRQRQQPQQLREASPLRYNMSTRYDGRRSPHDLPQTATRWALCCFTLEMRDYFQSFNCQTKQLSDCSGGFKDAENDSCYNNMYLFMSAMHNNDCLGSYLFIFLETPMYRPIIKLTDSLIYSFVYVYSFIYK